MGAFLFAIFVAMLSAWDKRFIGLAEHVSTCSEDPSLKVGCVIVSPGGQIISLGYNSFPRGITQDAIRYERPGKYLWVEHAERNAIYSAAQNGRPLKGCSLYIQYYPCAECARAIIQSGITRLFSPKPCIEHAHYADSFVVADAMLAEAGVDVVIY